MLALVMIVAMSANEPHRPAPSSLDCVDTARAATATAPGRPHLLHERAQLLLAGCHAVSAYDPYAGETVLDLIDEMRGLTEDVVSLMPADADRMAEELANAYAALVRLIDGVAHANAQSRCGVRRLRCNAAVAGRQAWPALRSARRKRC
jgi:hypothetical protein